MRLAAAALAFLAACEATSPSPSACAPGAFDDLVGQPLAAVSLPDGLPQRVVQPGDVVTMEYRPDRLTLRLDDEGVVREASCG